MKRLFSLGLIAILLLNVMGYYGVFLGLQYRNDVAMIKKLDSNSYEESQTVTLKIPFAVPYMMTESQDFERVDGKFEYEGKSYRLVKQKYSQDTLTMICVLDVEHERIQDVLEDYVKTFTDHAGDQNQQTKLTLSFIKDYIPQTFSLHSITSGWQVDLSKNTPAQELIPTFVTSVIHPPERG